MPLCIWNVTNSQPLDLFDEIILPNDDFSKKHASHLWQVLITPNSYISPWEAQRSFYDSLEINFFEPGGQVYQSVSDELVST